MRVCVCVCVRVQSYPTFCDSMDYSRSGSSVREIFQARTLERVAISWACVCACHFLGFFQIRLSEGKAGELYIFKIQL